MQETLLARRAVQFTHGEMVWERQYCSDRECGATLQTYRMDNMASTGRYENHIAGLWEDDLNLSLLWDGR